MAIPEALLKYSAIPKVPLRNVLPPSTHGLLKFYSRLSFFYFLCIFATLNGLPRTDAAVSNGSTTARGNEKGKQV